MVGDQLTHRISICRNATRRQGDSHVDRKAYGHPLGCQKCRRVCEPGSEVPRGRQRRPLGVDAVRLVARNVPGVLRVRGALPDDGSVSGQGVRDGTTSGDGGFRNQQAKCPAEAGLPSGSFRGNVPRQVDALASKALGASLPRRALGLQLGLVDGHAATFKVGAVEALDRGIRVRVVVHLHEAEAPGLAAESVADQIHLAHFTKPGKGLTQLGLSDAERKVAYIESHVIGFSEVLCLERFGTVEGNQAQKFLRARRYFFRKTNGFLLLPLVLRTLNACAQLVAYAATSSNVPWCRPVIREAPHDRT